MLVLLPLVTLFGNFLVCLSVKREDSLRTVSNYFICSLAIADMMVALLVMPFAIYVEVMGGMWYLGSTLCDVWIAIDVIACTASILNLTAISVDRFVAVTRPLKHARYRNSKRVFFLIAATWVVSLAIGLPILMGVNDTEERRKPENLLSCQFMNPKFIICSSMGSFFIPSFIMFVIYCRIYVFIRARSLKQMERTSTSAMDSQSAPLTAQPTAPPTARVVASVATVRQEGVAEVEPRTLVESFTRQEELRQRDEVAGHGGPGPQRRALEVQAAPGSGGSVCGVNAGDKRGCSHHPARSGEGSSSTANERARAGSRLRLPSFVLVNLSFPRRRESSARRLERRGSKSSQRRRKEEKKATKILVIVFGVFMVCWMPFFVVHTMNGICMTMDDRDRIDLCHIPPTMFLVFTWLGYVNSCLNPAIYTIFNIEFRKAFRKILTQPCK